VVLTSILARRRKLAVAASSSDATRAPPSAFLMTQFTAFAARIQLAMLA
jgi:hypothetical protein